MKTYSQSTASFTFLPNERKALLAVLWICGPEPDTSCARQNERWLPFTIAMPSPVRAIAEGAR